MKRFIIMVVFLVCLLGGYVGVYILFGSLHDWAFGSRATLYTTFSAILAMIGGCGLWSMALGGIVNAIESYFYPQGPQ